MSVAFQLSSADRADLQPGLLQNPFESDGKEPSPCLAELSLGNALPGISDPGHTIYDPHYRGETLAPL